MQCFIVIIQKKIEMENEEKFYEQVKLFLQNENDSEFSDEFNSAFKEYWGGYKDDFECALIALQTEIQDKFDHDFDLKNIKVEGFEFDQSLEITVFYNNSNMHKDYQILSYIDVQCDYDFKSNARESWVRAVEREGYNDALDEYIEDLTIEEIADIYFDEDVVYHNDTLIVGSL
jgi:hypothetical protein